MSFPDDSQNTSVKRNEFQTVGAVCVLIATKLCVVKSVWLDL